MCGIAGIVSPEGGELRQNVENMIHSLRHRGPDAWGVWHDDALTACLGHTRLSILDLNPRANQPMMSQWGRFVLVYNGELYNYRQIARKLSLKLHTTSDSEVLLEAFARLGPECFTMFNGMMAAAIWDKQEKKLFLARDRVGKKPLFYYQNGTSLYFASEIKALLRVIKVPQPHREALSWYLHLGYIPQPLTAFSEIYKFPSAAWGVFAEGLLNIYEYWNAGQLIPPEPKQLSETEAIHQLAILLEDAVRLRMVSDVPYGAFLSGGIDSSMVTFLAAHQYAGKLKTYTIGFKEAAHDESRWAEKVAAHLQTDHRTFILSEKEAAEALPGLLDVYDEPFADTSAIPSLLIARQASREVKMVLTGDGGDELFMGYGSYRWARRLSRPPWKNFHNLLARFFSLGPDRYRRVARLLAFDEKTWLPGHIFSQEQYFFSEDEFGDKRIRLPRPGFLPLPGTGRALTPEELQAFFDLNYYLKDDLLVKVDRATMRYGLEARSPLLDYRLVEFALNLPVNLRMKKGHLKYLLRQALFHFVPEDLFDRPKQGFSIPLSQWLRNELKGYVDENLSDNLIHTYGLVDAGYIRQLRHFFENGHHHLYNRIWALAQIHAFLKKHW